MSEQQGPGKQASSGMYTVVNGQLWALGTTDYTNPGGLRSMIPDSSGQQPAAGTFSSTVDSLLKRYTVGTPEFNELRKLLIKHYGLSENSFGKDDAFSVAFERAVNGVSLYNYNYIHASASGDTSQTKTLMDYLRSKKADTTGSGGYSGPESVVTYTGKPTAKDAFISISKQILGTAPSKNDFEDFYKKLHAAEKNYVDKRNADGSVVTQNQFNLNDFTLNYIVNSIDLSNKDMSGNAGAAQDSVVQAISDYGLKGLITNKTKIKLIRGLLNGSLQQKDIDDTLRDQAISVHTAFADDIKANPNRTFLDIMQPYISKYTQTLEVPETDVDISRVVSLATDKNGKKISANNFDAILRSTNDFSKTTTAKAEAQNLAVSFARAFGVNV